MPELIPPLGSAPNPGTYEDWKAYAQKLEQEVFDKLAELDARWHPVHVLFIAVAAFVAGWII